MHLTTSGGDVRGSGWPWNASSVTVNMDMRLKTGRMRCRQRVLLRSHSSKWPPLSREMHAPIHIILAEYYSMRHYVITTQI
jgi:hypothetical protein